LPKRSPIFQESIPQKRELSGSVFCGKPGISPGTMSERSIPRVIGYTNRFKQAGFCQRKTGFGLIGANIGEIRKTPLKNGENRPAGITTVCGKYAQYGLRMPFLGDSPLKGDASQKRGHLGGGGRIPETTRGREYTGSSRVSQVTLTNPFRTVVLLPYSFETMRLMV